MAIWQCDFLFVARSAASEVLAGAIIEPEVRNALVRDAWAASQPPSDIEARLGGVLTRAGSWDASRLAIWGSDEGNRLDLRRVNRRVATLRVRFDLRAPDAHFIRTVLDLAQECDCLLLGELGLVEPQPDLVARALLRSRAAAFVSDPMGFIERLARGRKPG